MLWWGSQMKREPHTRVERIALVESRDERGRLVAAQTPDSLPFAPQRFFSVSGVPAGTTRGDHAHRSCHQFLVCTAGRVDVIVKYPDAREEIVELDEPCKGLHILPLTWSCQHYVSDDAVLLVAASEKYDAAEYITDFDEYLELSRTAADQH